MTDRELLEKALEALEHLHRTGDTQVFDLCYAPELIPALKERLAQSERTWVGLTDEEMRQAAQAMAAEPLAEGWRELIKFARAIEAKLKEKNG